MHREFPDATRLLLTGYADISAVIEAINSGNVFRYVTKPWNPDELQTIVREAFDKYWLIVDNRRLMEEQLAANLALEERVQARTRELTETNERLGAINEQKDRLVGVVQREITERKRAEDALREVHELAQRRAAELAAFNQAMVGRELRIIEMKEEVNALCQGLGREPKYLPVWRTEL